MPATHRRRPARLVLVDTVTFDEEPRDGVDGGSTERDVPTPRTQGDGDVLGVHRRCAQEEHRAGRRLLDHLEQRIGGRLGEPVGILDDDDLPAAGSGAAGRQLHDVTDDGHRQTQAVGDDMPDIGVCPGHHRHAGTAVTTAGVRRIVGLALQRRGERGGRDRATRAGRPGEQPGVGHRGP
jgi:hypothetical protein